ncbi:hypothetical protein [Streptosporangium sp. NPDC000396]|uniref:hypothetical protein n=1 Tax=Streptosporangium sp. NPDC000396 TaxID=3366185 RepID=UPI0036BE28CD
MSRREGVLRRVLELQALAEREFDRGDWKAALDAGTESIVLLRGLTPPESGTLAGALDLAARCLLALGRAGEALPLAREAVGLSDPADDARPSRARTLAACRRSLDRDDGVGIQQP